MVTLTAIDNANQTSIGVATVTIQDILSPIVSVQDIIVSLDATGAATISTTDIDNGSSDNCGITNMALDITDFNCSHIGTNTVILTVSDQSGNIQTGTATVTVEDNNTPTVMTNQNIIVNLDTAGVASISIMDVNNGSTDNCGISSMTLDIMDFNCSNLGMNTVTLTVTDQGGNVQTGTTTVVVEDNIAPTIVASNPTIFLDGQGMATINAADIATITDNCGVDSVTLGLTQFDCDDIGMNLVSIQVTDAAGNTAMGSALVTVADTLPVTILCPEPISAFACDSSVVVNYDPPTLNGGTCDNNPGTPTLVSGLPSGSTFPVGTTTNTYSYTAVSYTHLTLPTKA